MLSPCAPRGVRPRGPPRPDSAGVGCPIRRPGPRRPSEAEPVLVWRLHPFPGPVRTNRDLLVAEVRYALHTARRQVSAHRLDRRRNMRIRVEHLDPCFIFFLHDDERCAGGVEICPVAAVVVNMRANILRVDLHSIIERATDGRARDNSVSIIRLRRRCVQSEAQAEISSKLRAQRRATFPCGGLHG